MRRIRADLGNWVSAAVSAIQLMTRVPVPFTFSWNDTVGRRSLVFYPLAGAVIGGALGIAYWSLPELLPAAPAAAIVVVLWIWITGGLHLDGWMDTADALGSHRSKERMLEIMKDPRVGAMGVAAGVSLLLLKWTLLFSLLEYTLSGSPNIGAMVAVIPVITRTMLPWVIVAWPYSGGSSGMGASLQLAGARHAAASTLLGALAIFIFLELFGTGDALFLLPLLALGGFAAAAAGAIAAVYVRRRIGGLTGDSYGAIVEGTELLLLLLLVLAGYNG